MRMREVNALLIWLASHEPPSLSYTSPSHLLLKAPLTSRSMPSSTSSSACHLSLALVALIIAISAFPAHAERRQQEQRTPLVVTGKVLDDQDSPIPNSLIQIWQTHPSSGLYNHPSSAAPEQIDPTFQYFGTAAAEEDGSFEFVTYKPAPFSYRAPHIHFKVWLPSDDGDDEGNDSKTNVLTSQFYFREDGTRADERLLLDLEEVSDVNGNAALLTNKNIVIGGSNGNTGGNTVTPSQMEGPFYPVEIFFDFSSNLIKTVDDVPKETINDPATSMDQGGSGVGNEEEVVDIADEDDVDTSSDAGKSASSSQEAKSPSSPAAIASFLALPMLLSIATNLLHLCL